MMTWILGKIVELLESGETNWRTEKCGRMRRQEEKIDPVRSKFGKIEKEEVPLPDKLLYVETYARTHKKFSFRMLLEKQRSKMHIVVTFLAVLELMKTGMIRVYQEEICGEILIDSQI